LSRTAHHIPYKHWNIKKRTQEYKSWPPSRRGIVQWEETLGVILYDLRFYAGCKRQPQLIRRERWETSYGKTWGHAGGLAHGLAEIYQGAIRSRERVYATQIRKLANAGSDLDELIEPEGRVRHGAVWDAW
jgi:hypothetical protein